MTPPRGGKKVRRWVLGEGYVSPSINNFSVALRTSNGMGVDGKPGKTIQLKKPFNSILGTKKYRLLLEECE